MSKYHTTVLSQSFQMMWVTGKYQLGASSRKISVQKTFCKISNRWERKRRCMSIRSAILFHNNTRSHVAALIQEKIDKIYWKPLERLSYSAKLSPCNYQSLDARVTKLSLWRQRQRRCCVRNWIEQWGVFKILFTIPINVLQQKCGSYLIRTRIRQSCP